MTYDKTARERLIAELAKYHSPSQTAADAAAQLEADGKEISRLQAQIDQSTLDVIRQRDEVLAIAEDFNQQRVCDLENENAQLCAEVERMRSVVEAAVKWAPKARARAMHAQMSRDEIILWNASNTYRAEKEKP